MMRLAAIVDRWLSSRPHWRQKAMESLEMCEQQAAHYRGLLDGRDKFIVDAGLWEAFVASLPKRDAQAGVTEGRDALAARGAEGE